MRDYQELKSWTYTLLADIAIDIIAGILFGIGTLIETGDFKSAAVMAICVASTRSAMKAGFNKMGTKLKSMKSE